MFNNSQIIDEKSLIKKYQNEIRSLKEELEQLKRGIVTIPRLKDIVEDDIVLLKQKVLLKEFYNHLEDSFSIS
jgi:centromeric protein E